MTKKLYHHKLLIVLSFLLCSCSSQASLYDPGEGSPTVTSTATFAPEPSPTVAILETITEPGLDQLGTEIAELSGCRLPSSDYTVIQVNGYKLNQRTYDMLVYAQSLYPGQINIIEAITQGSYTDSVAASFGTHKGGGAVDLSVLAPGTILYGEIEPLIHALRLAGFAAWFRDFDELYDGSPVHIHAIAIGDSELSLSAREQLAGPFGYFWGYDGLPRENGIPQRDPHGGPIVCDWMIDQGYPNKTATPNP